MKAFALVLVVVATVSLGGCTTVQRNQVALGLCDRTAWCTHTERELDPSGPPQVQAMEGAKRERVVNPKK